MKAEVGDKLVEENCYNCVFNFGNVCGGHGIRKNSGEDTYRMPIEETLVMLTEDCRYFSISLNAFIKQEQLNER